MNIKSGHIIVVLVVTVVTFVSVTGFWGRLITMPGPLTEEIEIGIPRGAGVSTIAHMLEDAGVVDSYILFRLSTKLMFSEKLLQAGGYRFEPGVSLRDVIKMLERGHNVSYKVTIPEGLRTHEIMDILKNAKNMVQEKKALPDLNEKIALLPETYAYDFHMTARQVIQRMRTDAEKVIDAAWAGRDLDVPLKDKSELLVLASIIEKETAIRDEYHDVAGVFVNRLKKGMKLQTDPTVIFGLENYDGNIRKKDLKNPHPYNTYVHKGLPPGPICHPGKAAIFAAANPSRHDFYYFVADGSGGHKFAKTLAEHNKNVQNYLKWYRKNVK